MESRGPEDSKNVKTSQAYFFGGFISFFEDFSLTISPQTPKTIHTTSAQLKILKNKYQMFLTAVGDTYVG